MCRCKLGEGHVSDVVFRVTLFLESRSYIHIGRAQYKYLDTPVPIKDVTCFRCKLGEGHVSDVVFQNPYHRAGQASKLGDLDAEVGPNCLFSASWFALDLVGIRRPAEQIRGFENDDLGCSRTPTTAQARPPSWATSTPRSDQTAFFLPHPRDSPEENRWFLSQLPFECYPPEIAYAGN